MTAVEVLEPEQPAEGIPLRTLDELACVVTEGHRQAEDALRSWLDNAVLVGRALMEARPQVPSGMWMQWLTAQGLAQTTSNWYRRAAVYEEALRAVGALSRADARRFLEAHKLGSGISPGDHARVDDDVRRKAVALVREHGLSRAEAGRLVGVAASTVGVWLDPEIEARHTEKKHQRARAKAEAREADLARQLREAARDVGGDYEKAVEYMTKLDQILGRAREQAGSSERRIAVNEAHKYRDRAMDALRRGLGL